MANPQALFDNAVAALNSGDLAKAAKLAGKLCKQHRNAADAWVLRATIAGAAQAFADAKKFYRRALQLRPGDTAALNNLGGTYWELGSAADAIACYRKSLAVEPAQPNTLYNLGKVLNAEAQFDAAVETFQAGVALRPDDPEIRQGLAYGALKAGELPIAVENYQWLIDNGREDAAALRGLYSALAQLGRLDDAEAALDRLLEIAGDDPDHHVDGSILYLIQGRWYDGWTAYAKRWQANPGEARPLPQPRWDGEPLDGRSLTVWGEQGLGDEIMYASMVPDLADGPGEIVFEMDARNVALFQRSFPNVRCIPRTAPPDPAATATDFQIPVGDLGIWFRHVDGDFHDGRPFLKPDPERTRALRDKYRNLGDADNLIVGITWRSFGAVNGHLKSIDLETYRPIIEIPGTTFVDLQYGDVTAEREAFEQATGLTVHKDPDVDPMADIDDHAAQVAAMDLIVSTSNTTVHLGGAMGVPTWILIQEIADRRWLLARDDSPWYGSVRLFRKETESGWPGLLAQVADDLTAFAAQSRQTSD